VTGANWISTTLDSPLRAALLADECGTGKTVQIGLALAMHYHRVKAEVEAGTFRPRDDKRRFKPSIILCPSNLAYQTFREWSNWFPNFFKIKICYGKKAQAVDELAKRHTMKGKVGLQSWVDENAASHRNIEVSDDIYRLMFFF
jgi:SNF2 family DNA or RNA helicase